MLGQRDPVISDSGVAKANLFSGLQRLEQFGKDANTNCAPQFIEEGRVNLLPLQPNHRLGPVITKRQRISCAGRNAVYGVPHAAPANPCDGI